MIQRLSVLWSYTDDEVDEYAFIMRIVFVGYGYSYEWSVDDMIHMNEKDEQWNDIGSGDSSSRNSGVNITDQFMLGLLLNVS